MARAVTAKFEEMILEVNFTPLVTPAVYSRICGITDVEITRQSQIDTTEVPDCDDESLPLAIERQVRSQEVMISGSGVWALEYHERLMDWWYSGAALPVRLRNAKAEADGATGDTIAEAGDALLVNLNNTRTKGQKVTASIELQFDGVPARTPKPAA